MKSRPNSTPLLALLSTIVLLAGGIAAAAPSAPVQQRVSADLDRGEPVVAHVVVALCDNDHQGIVPVPASLGNGQDPRSNLYWGALYGVRTHLKKTGWKLVAEPSATDSGILSRIVLTATVKRDERDAPVYVVADAWDGSRMRPAVKRFLEMVAGHGEERLTLESDSGTVRLRAGGAAHLAVFVGHNGLMDFRLGGTRPPAPESPPRAAAVLACASRPYFAERLDTLGAHPLLLTTGLMAPEAYTLDALVRSWASGASPAETREAAATAYDRYQKCGRNAARRLFWSGP